MSVFAEFCAAWAKEFPGEEVPRDSEPSVWDDNIQAKLQRHKKNLQYLKAEVLKEEFYCKFLENTISVLEARKQQASPNVSEASVSGDSAISEASSSASALSEKVRSEVVDKEDFITVISVNKLVDAHQEEKSRSSVAGDVRPKAPPKPPKQYSRSVSSESSTSSKPPEDVVAWTKQQIQQLQSKQPLKIGETSTDLPPPPKIPLPETPDSAASMKQKRISYENVSRTRQDYENVFPSSVTRPKEQESGDIVNKHSQVPVTDIDADPGRVQRATAFFQQQQMPRNSSVSSSAPQLPPKRSSAITSSDPYYDCVPQEENINYIDAEDYIYLLDKSLDDEKEKNGTLKSFGSTTSDDSSSTGSLRRRLYANLTSLDDLTTSDMNASRSLTSKQQLVLQNFFDSEENYVAALNVVLHYSKALTAALNSSQPVIAKEEIACIFFHIPELYLHHSEFLQQIKSSKVADWNLIQVAQLLKNLSETALPEYAIFLANFKEALEATRKACQHSTQFADLARRIKLRANQQQTIISLEDLLHKPVARIQRHVAVIQDLLDVSTQDEPAYIMLQEAQNLTKIFLSEFSTHQLQSLFPGQSSKNSSSLQSNRHLVKNGFLVELQTDGKRKQRHVFLFTDLIVCTKYKGSGAHLEVKWYLPLSHVEVLIDDSASKLSASALTNVASLRSQASAVRTQMDRSGSDKQRKKLASLEAKLLLDSPNLPLRFVYKPKGSSSKPTQSYTFLLSSEFERTLWIEATETLRRHIERLPPASLPIPQTDDVENHVKACRTAVEPLGGMMRNSSLPALGGELQLVVHSLRGLPKHADVYVVIELDSYGHYFHKARTKMAIKSLEPRWEEDFNLELEGTRGLRVLVYEEDAKQMAILRGKAELELSVAWLKSLKGPQYLPLTHQLSKQASLSRNSTKDELTLCLTLRYLSYDLTIRRPAQRSSGSAIFGVPIEEVCQREKRPIPHIISSCVREIERRGLDELGIYRVSGLATDITKLRKAFDTRGHDSDSLLRDVDVNSVTGLLKLYLRQLPEALFTDRLYPHFLHAFSTLDAKASLSGVEDITCEGGARTLTQLFSSLPAANQNVIVFMLEHLVKVYSRESKNKMSLHNLATVFGPTMLRPAPSTNGTDSQESLLAMGTMDVMAQAGILYFFLHRRAQRVPIQCPPLTPAASKSHIPSSPMLK